MREVFFLLILTLLGIAPISAQSSNATVNGIVLDPSGAVIAGAQVVVVNDATGVQYTTKTNEEGIYVVPSLPPGSYRIQVSNSGFKTIVKPDIIIHVQDGLAINFTLPMGASSEIVTVQGGVPLVNTQNAAVSTVIDRNFVESMPLNGRSFNTLLQLTPGVVISPANAANGQPGQFSIAGQRSDANNFTIDGVSANFGIGPGVGGVGQSGTGNAQALSALGSTSSLVSVDALEEFRIETSSFAPEFGRAPGGQVILTTRSGTNDIHGGLFDYFRNTVMDANNWFADQAGLPRAPEHHNDFGGFLGGPIWKNKTFFFISYEGARLNLPQTGLDQVPSEFARSVAPSTLAPFLNAYPQPDDRNIVPGVYTARFTGNYANLASLDAASVRVDHRVGDHVSLFGRFNYAPSGTVGRDADLATLSTVTSTEVNTQTLTIGSLILLSTQIMNSLRGNYSEQTSNQEYSLDSFGGAVPLAPGTLFDTLPEVNTYGSFDLADANLLVMGPTARNRTRQFNVVDDASISAGSHQFKVGGDYRALFLEVIPSTNEILLSSPSVQTFLSDGVANLGAETAAQSHVLTKALSLYAQDTWKANRRLTLTYGVRWELDPAPTATGKTVLASWENVDTPSQIALAPPGTPIWRTTYGDFAPRIGLAYRFAGDDSFVFRVGGGVFYDLGVGSSALLAVGFPNRAGQSYPGVQVPVTGVTGYLPTLSAKPPFPVTEGVSPDLVLPRSYQWNVALEKSLSPKQIISATYLGQAGKDLLRTAAFFKPNLNFTNEFFLAGNDAFSNYDALQLQYRKALASGLQVLANYTWSHSLDNSSNDAVAGLSNTVISGATDYASSNFDIRNSFSGALSYAIPGASRYRALSELTRNWSIDSLLVARSGFPFNAIVIGTSPDPGGQVRTRPDLVPGQPMWLPDPAAAGGKSLNPNAFAVPSTIRQGTEGRNDIRGFGLTQLDISVARAFVLTERTSLHFRADAFNALNHPNFTNPLGYFQFGPSYLASTQMLNQGLGGLSPIFQEGGPRSLQLSLKLTF